MNKSNLALAPASKPKHQTLEVTADCLTAVGELANDYGCAKAAIMEASIAKFEDDLADFLLCEQPDKNSSYVIEAIQRLKLAKGSL